MLAGDVMSEELEARDIDLDREERSSPLHEAPLELQELIAQIGVRLEHTKFALVEGLDEASLSPANNAPAAPDAGAGPRPTPRESSPPSRTLRGTRRPSRGCEPRPRNSGPRRALFLVRVTRCSHER